MAVLFFFCLYVLSFVFICFTVCVYMLYRLCLYVLSFVFVYFIVCVYMFLPSYVTTRLPRSAGGYTFSQGNYTICGIKMQDKIKKAAFFAKVV